MIRLLRDRTGGELLIAALAEDGMFEKKLWYPVALLGGMLWDCDKPCRELIHDTALRQDVELA